MKALLLLLCLAGIATAQDLHLEWDDNSDNETGFRIERKEVGGEWTELGTTEAGVALYTDTTFVQGRAYAYRVLAFNDAGSSDPSDELIVGAGTIHVTTLNVGTLNVQ